MTEKKRFQISLRYDQPDLSPRMSALAGELKSRGHDVKVDKVGIRSTLASEIARSAGDFKDLTKNVREVAESGMNLLREAIAPIVTKSGDKSGDKSGEESRTDSSKAPLGQSSSADAPFDDIGPGSLPSSQPGRALVVTSPSCLDPDAAWDALRIGLLATTALESAWSPSTLDAMVIPHPAFRPYLETIQWSPERIFEGGYLPDPDDIPHTSHEDALSRFNLNPEDGIILVVMTSGFDLNDLQNLMVQLTLVQHKLQVFFYHAGDAAKAEALRLHAQRFGVRARMFGRVDHLADTLAMADLAVASDAHDIATLETAGIPLIDVIHQETSPVSVFLAHEGSARHCKPIHQLANTIGAILTPPNGLSDMRVAATEIAKRASTALCADAIEAALSSGSVVVPAPGQRAASMGGFEVIGSDPVVASNPSMITPTAPAATPSEAPTTAAAILAPVMTARSKVEIQEEYTKLVLAEKNIDKALDAASADVHQWELRLDLARQNHRDDLVTSAVERLNTAKAEEIALLKQKDQIQQQKVVLKQSARLAQGAGSMKSVVTSGDELFAPDPEADKLNAEFEKLQKEEALAQLRKRLGK